jgi:hypothetical protein
VELLFFGFAVCLSSAQVFHSAGFLLLPWLFPAFFSFQVGMDRNSLSGYGVGSYLATVMSVWCSF